MTLEPISRATLSKLLPPEPQSERRILVLAEPGRVAQADAASLWPGSTVRPLVPAEPVEGGASPRFDVVLTVDLARHGHAIEHVLAHAQRFLRPRGRLLAYESSRATARPLGRTLRHYFAPSGRRPVDGGFLLVSNVRDYAEIAGHFRRLAPAYESQIPKHVREHYLDHKVAVLERALPFPREGMRGLDLGCGIGSYATTVARRLGVRIVGADATLASLRLARGKPGSAVETPSFVGANGLALPFLEGTFDFAYAINLVHHLKRGEQERALRELARVLKPGAPFFLFEINIQNPLFHWYMRKVFPRTRRIDRGDEEFVHPKRLPLVEDFEVERIEYSTFTPDFIPKWMLPPFRWMEGKLEAGRWAKYAIHYVALMRRSRVDPENLNAEGRTVPAARAAARRSAMQPRRGGPPRPTSGGSSRPAKAGPS